MSEKRHAAALAAMDEVLATTNWTFDMLRDPTWQPSREDYRHMRDALAAEVRTLRGALREEFFRILPDLDYEIEVTTDDPDGGWAWKQHPWFSLLGLTDDDCIVALAAGSPAREDATP